MDSFTSTENSGEARVVEIATVSGQTTAIDQLIGLARHHIRVFDQDLSQTGWSSAARVDRLASFLRGVDGPAARRALRQVVAWKVNDPHMSAGEQARMWRVVDEEEQAP